MSQKKVPHEAVTPQPAELTSSGNGGAEYFASLPKHIQEMIVKRRQNIAQDQTSTSGDIQSPKS